MAEGLQLGQRVMLRIPDKPELDGVGVIICELRPGDGRVLYQVDLGDHDNWFPAEWLRLENS